MTGGGQERRKHARKQCFFIASERERVPVWVFTPADESEAHAGVILDFSETGVRILTASDHPLDASRYRMSLLVESPSGASDRVGCVVTRAWSEPEGRDLVSGMHFEDNTEAAAAFIAANPPSAKERSWIRCALSPIE